MNGFCPKCGKPITDGQAFCSSCGTNVGGAAPVGDFSPSQQPYAQQQSADMQKSYYPKPKKKGALIIILSIVFLFLAGGTVAAIFLFGPYNAKPAELNGEWNCVMRVDHVLKEYAEFISEDNKGDEKNVQMALTLDKKGKGQMVVSGMTLNAVYKDGKISAASMLDDKLAVTIDATLKKDKDGFAFIGIWKYAITKGAQKGDVASGSWIALLLEPGSAEGTPAMQNELPGDITAEPPAPSQSVNSGIIAADMEGAWKGQLVMTDIPGLDANPNITEEDKATMRADIGTSTEMVFVFRNGKLWIGDEEDAEDITDSDMGLVAFSGNSLNADVVTPIGNASVKGDVIEEGGKKLIKCSLTFPDVTAAGDGTQKVTVLAAFSGEKQ